MQSVLILALAWIATGAVGEPPRQAAIRLEFVGRVVTVVADHARASDVLTEWARVGHTEVIGADLLSDRTVTLNLTSVDEQDALTQVVGAGFGFIGPLKEGPEAGTSRFSRIIVSAVKPRPAQAQRPSTNEPESRYSYTPSAHLLVGNDSVAGEAQPRPAGNKTPDPETIFDYTAPQLEKLREPGADSESIAGTVRSTGVTSGDPEVRFEYSAPKYVAESPDIPVSGSQAPARTAAPRVDPEVRFDYSRSSKTFEPPRKESSDGAPCSDRTAGTPKEKCRG